MLARLTVNFSLVLMTAMAELVLRLHQNQQQPVHQPASLPQIHQLASPPQIHRLASLAHLNVSSDPRPSRSRLTKKTRTPTGWYLAHQMSQHRLAMNAGSLIPLRTARIKQLYVKPVRTLDLPNETQTRTCGICWKLMSTTLG